VFKCFPLGDKSSVNRQGDYNTDNVTTFEALPLLEDHKNADPDAMETTVETDSEPAKAQSEKDTRPSMTTDELYPAFWDMQKSFANPTKVLQPEVFIGFKRSFDATLEKFKSMPKMLSTSSEGRGTKRGIDDMETDDFAADRNPKYLTSRELFGLEVNAPKLDFTAYKNSSTISHFNVTS
jgi:THO complex subunit 1